MTHAQDPADLPQPARGSTVSIVLMIALVVWTLTSGTTLRAGTYHNNAKMNCLDCHTQHNSQKDAGGVSRSMRYDQPGALASGSAASPYLLRSGAETELCLSCHSGVATAPSVINSYAANHAAGSFPSTYTGASNMAHTISATAVTVPDNPALSLPLTCTTCHDPHGNGSYRNLRPDPSRSGKVPVTVLANQTAQPGSGAPIDTIYSQANIVYKSGISTWCTKCHMAPQPGSDHPDSVTMWGSTVASYTRWASTTYPRVPVDSPTDNAIPSNDDRVTCLSCHFSHGGQDYKFLRYNGSTEVQTCGECHDQ